MGTKAHFYRKQKWLRKILTHLFDTNIKIIENYLSKLKKSQCHYKEKKTTAYNL